MWRKTKEGRQMKAMFRVFLVVLLGLTLVSCSKFKTYKGERVTKIEVHKAERKLYLLSGKMVLKSYAINLGGNPIGPKQFEGDGKTPEGAYFITHKNPNSTYHLSLGISYPDASDMTFAKANGKPAGGDIFVHGGPNKRGQSGDWTAGCIAVTDKQMEEIFAMVPAGTPIFIYP
jgi:murein L,D-transpeptidase YafK